MTLASRYQTLLWRIGPVKRPMVATDGGPRPQSSTHNKCHVQSCRRRGCLLGKWTNGVPRIANALLWRETARRSGTWRARTKLQTRRVKRRSAVTTFVSRSTDGRSALPSPSLLSRCRCQILTSSSLLTLIRIGRQRLSSRGAEATRDLGGGLHRPERPHPDPSSSLRSASG
jgi:hypothetical protein